MDLKQLLLRLGSAVPRHRKKLLLGLVGGLIAAYYYNRKRLNLERECAAGATSARKSKQNPSATTTKVGVNISFLQQLRKLLPICVPGVASKEFALLVGLAIILIIRTGLDIWFAAFNGRVVRSIVTRDWKLFMKNAVYIFAVMMWPMSIVNNSIKLVINTLTSCFRDRLTRHAHNQYLNGRTFYKVSNLDNRIQNVDQLLSQDIVKFSESLSHLYSDLSKPVVDICLFALKLGQSIGSDAPVMMLTYFFASGWLLKTISPPFGKFAAKEQSLEGEFRYAHSRIITHAEEIAFYKGAAKEKSIVNGAFDRILRHANRVFFLRFGNGIIDSVLVKYFATQLAYYLLARPVFQNQAIAASSLTAATSSDPTLIMESYSKNSGYLINLSQAVGRLVLAGRDLTRFAGYTWRVSELFNVLEDINERHRYQRVMISQASPTGISEICTVDESSLAGEVEIQSLVGGQMDLFRIEFEHVPIMTPNGDLLVKDLSFTINRGMNCLVTGPNGCGKSSLFRILGQLWPLFGGKLVKPPQERMFYVPQRPYLPLGSLRDQLIYPAESHEADLDDRLLELLKIVHLEYLLTEPGGWNTVQDWQEVLSGGEKQRMAMARLFYHRPAFAILDECTSAVSIDVEGLMYRYAQETLGITLFTISHRPSLVPFHEYLLRFDGLGGYEFIALNHASGSENRGDGVGADKGSLISSGPVEGASVEAGTINPFQFKPISRARDQVGRDGRLMKSVSIEAPEFYQSDAQYSAPHLLYSYPRSPFKEKDVKADDDALMSEDEGERARE